MYLGWVVMGIGMTNRIWTCYVKNRTTVSEITHITIKITQTFDNREYVTNPVHYDIQINKLSKYEELG